MEKLSSFERVVGDLSETEKERILYDMGERFDDQVFEDLIGKEREKTKEELQNVWEELKEVNKECWHRSFSSKVVEVKTIIETKYDMLS